MKVSIFCLSAVLLSIVFVVGPRGAPAGSVPENSSGRRRPELEYFKVINSVAPPQDPQILFLLMGQYSNANLQNDGVEFFSARLKEFGPRLSDAQKSLYLSAIGLLRAQNASSVSFLHRIGYVKDTIAILEQARQLSRGQIFVVNWIAGIVYTELPGFFHQQKAAQDELNWCAENASKAPDPGWLREVYYHLGKLALARGEQAKAQDYLRRSGYKDFSSPITLTAQFLARWRWMSMPNHSANAGNKRGLLWGLHASELMPGPQSSAISAEAVSSTIRLMATPSTWRRGWKSPISNLAPAFWSVRLSPIGWRTLAADRSVT